MLKSKYQNAPWPSWGEPYKARLGILWKNAENMYEIAEKSKSLAKQYGLFVGFSAAANFLVAERLIEEGYAKNVVTILCDRGERYFSCL